MQGDTGGAIMGIGIFGNDLKYMHIHIQMNTVDHMMESGQTSEVG